MVQPRFPASPIAFRVTHALGHGASVLSHFRPSIGAPAEWNLEAESGVNDIRASGSKPLGEILKEIGNGCTK